MSVHSPYCLQKKLKDILKVPSLSPVIYKLNPQLSRIDSLIFLKHKKPQLLKLTLKLIQENFDNYFQTNDKQDGIIKRI